VVDSLKGKIVVQAGAGETHGLFCTGKHPTTTTSQLHQCFFSIVDFTLTLSSALFLSRLTDDGAVYTFGRGIDGCIGNGSRNLVNWTPVRVGGLRHEFVVQVKAGVNHCLAVTSGGKVYQWGKINRTVHTEEASGYFGVTVSLPGLIELDVIRDSHRQYYSGDMSTEEETAELKELANFGSFVSYLQLTPIPANGRLNNVKVVSVAAGYAFNLAVSNRGEVFGWGFNDKGQLGLGHRFNQEHPQRINALLNNNTEIVEVACGQQHSIAVSKSGAAYAWGLNVFGQLGLGHMNDQLSPAHILALKEHVVVSVACGAEHTVAITETGKVFSWGSSEYGQQGTSVGNFEDWGSGDRSGKTQSQQHALPKPLEAFADKVVIQVAAGYLHNLALTRDGEVWTWGWGVNGQLGHGNRRYQLVPRAISTIGEEIVSVAAGGKHSLAINSGSATSFAFDFKQLVNNKTYSDLEFLVEGKTVYGHKAVMASRCPRIAAEIFFNERNLGMDPKLKSIYPLPKSVKYFPFMVFLNYLYTDHLPSTKSHLYRDLVALARRFNVPRLVNLCEWYTTRRESKGLSHIPPSSFSQDMNHLLTTGPFSDISFILEGIEAGDFSSHVVKAHKVVLSSRSDFFKTIFECSFREQGQNQLKMPDIDKESFEAVLEFIYTGETNVSERVIEILMAADRLLMDDLKQKCEMVLAEGLDEENCGYLLEVSEQFSAPRLKRVCAEMQARATPTPAQQQVLAAAIP
jgi:alpha-tubulin suppressor-like RCC1 family protein